MTWHARLTSLGGAHMLWSQDTPDSFGMARLLMADFSLIHGDTACALDPRAGDMRLLDMPRQRPVDSGPLALAARRSQGSASFQAGGNGRFMAH